VNKFSFCITLTRRTIMHSESYIAPKAQTVSTSPALPYAATAENWFLHTSPGSSGWVSTFNHYDKWWRQMDRSDLQDNGQSDFNKQMFWLSGGGYTIASPNPKVFPVLYRIVRSTITYIVKQHFYMIIIR